MEMALYLELCVLQICGMRPVLGRVEDFSKEVKKLIRGNNLFIAFPTFRLEILKQVDSLINFIGSMSYSDRRACFFKRLDQVLEADNIICLSGIATNRGALARRAVDAGAYRISIGFKEN